MKLINANCPNCGAALDINSEKKQAFCQYCGSALLIDDEDKSKDYEEAGYSFEMGRQKAREELGIPQGSYENAQPKKRRTWLWVLGWIFIFPVPLSIIAARSKKLAVWLKAVIIIAAWLLYLIWLGYANSQDSQTAETGQGSATTSYSQTEEAVSES